MVLIGFILVQSSFICQAEAKNIYSVKKRKFSLFQFLTSYYLIIHANSLCAIFPDDDVRMSSTRSASWVEGRGGEEGGVG